MTQSYATWLSDTWQAPGEFNARRRKCEHGVILKLVATNICGSDQHMVRGRTTAAPGMVLGHEV